MSTTDPIKASFKANLLHRLSIDGGTITHNGTGYPVRGAHAEIVTSGFLVTRRTYLVISGPGYGWSVRLDSSCMGRATRFAAQVNAAAAIAEHYLRQTVPGR